MSIHRWRWQERKRNRSSHRPCMFPQTNCSLPKIIFNDIWIDATGVSLWKSSYAINTIQNFLQIDPGASTKVYVNPLSPLRRPNNSLITSILMM